MKHVYLLTYYLEVEAGVGEEEEDDITVSSSGFQVEIIELDTPLTPELLKEKWKEIWSKAKDTRFTYSLITFSKFQ